MKKSIYVTLFVFLGVLLQLIFHALIEIWYINLLLSDFSTYGFNLSWNQWFLIHHAGTIILLLCGMLFGFWQGNFWWKKLYEKKVEN